MTFPHYIFNIYRVCDSILIIIFHSISDVMNLTFSGGIFYFNKYSCILSEKQLSHLEKFVVLSFLLHALLVRTKSVCSLGLIVLHC